MNLATSRHIKNRKVMRPLPFMFMNEGANLFRGQIEMV